MALYLRPQGFDGHHPELSLVFLQLLLHTTAGEHTLRSVPSAERGFWKEA